MSHMPSTGGTPPLDLVEDDGTVVANGPHARLNFVGDGVTVADAGDGLATITIPGAGVAQGSPVNLPWVDLRASPWSVVANDATKAAANTAAVKAALVSYASTPAQLNFPAGTVYFDKDVTISNRASIILDGLVHSAPKTFRGQGRDVTTLQFQGTGNSGEWSGIKTANGFADFVISDMTLQFGTVTNPDPTGQMHILQCTNSTSGSLTTKNFHAYNLRFGPCIGAGFRVLGEAGTNHQNQTVSVHHCVFEQTGIGAGSRSCFEVQRGYRNIEFHHNYLYGAKNSLIDCESTTDAPEFGLNIHHCYCDGSNGRTSNAVSLGGSSTTAPAEHSYFTDNVVLQGTITMTSGDTWIVARNFHQINGYNTNQNYPAQDVYLNTPSIYVFQRNSNLSLIDNYIERTGVTAGNLIYLEASAVAGARPSYVTIRGGRLFQNCDGNIIQSEDCDRLKVSHVVMINTSSNASSYYGVGVRALNYDCNQTSIEHCTLVSTVAKTLGLVSFSATAGFALNDIVVVGNNAGNQVTYGAVFDLSLADGSTLDPYPTIQGNDFRAATNVWVASNHAAGIIFPVVAGNRGDVCHMVGTVTPSGAVAAIQGSRYTWMNGNSTQDFYKSTGTGNTGWSSAVVVP